MMRGLQAKGNVAHDTDVYGFEFAPFTFRPTTVPPAKVPTPAPVITVHSTTTLPFVLTPKPSPNPTPGPTPSPTPPPTNSPTPNPTSPPTPGPTQRPTEAPVEPPTPRPTPSPTAKPTSPPVQRLPAETSPPEVTTDTVVQPPVSVPAVATLAPLSTTTSPVWNLPTTTSTLFWSEEFNYQGLPDNSIWSHDLGGGGWGNHELQVYTDQPENVRVDGQVLKITAHKHVDQGGNIEFTSGRIHTDGKFSFTYGTLEARIHNPDLTGGGLWPAFWTLGSEYWRVGWPKAGELDIMEMGQGLALTEGLVNHRVVSAAHWDIMGEYATYARWRDSPIDLTNDYHVFRMEWNPHNITTYVDGQWVWEIDITEEACPTCAVFHGPHHIVLNLAVGGGFTSGGTSSSAAGVGSSSSSGCGGSSSAGVGSSSSGGCPTRTPEEVTASVPAEMKVDWIRLYGNQHTVIASKAPSKAPTLPPIDPSTSQAEAAFHAGVTMARAATESPSTKPFATPMAHPDTAAPTQGPVKDPTEPPTTQPTETPTGAPTQGPTIPTAAPTLSGVASGRVANNDYDNFLPMDATMEATDEKARAQSVAHSQIQSQEDIAIAASSDASQKGQFYAKILVCGLLISSFVL